MDSELKYNDITQEKLLNNKSVDKQKNTKKYILENKSLKQIYLFSLLCIFYILSLFKLLNIILPLSIFFAIQYYNEQKNQQKNLENYQINDCYNAINLNKLIRNLPSWVKFTDYEKCDFINNILGTMWPHLIKAIENSMRDALDPILNDQKPSFCSGLKLGIIDLGNKPLIITGINASNYDYSSENIIINIKFRQNGNSDIRVKANTVTELDIKLKNLDISGIFRIRLCHLNGNWPTFKTLQISFSEEPNIDFNLECIVPLTSIPGLSSQLDNLLKNLIVSQFTQPKEVKIDLLKLEERELREEEENKFKPNGILIIKIVKCLELSGKKKHVHLPNTKIKVGNKNDIFEKDIFETKIINKNNNPVFDETFNFIIMNKDIDTINLDVLYDHSKDLIQKTHIVSSKVFCLKDQKLTNSFKTVELDLLNDKISGTLVIDVKYLEITQYTLDLMNSNQKEDVSLEKSIGLYYIAILVVTIEKAENLKSCDLNGFSDPYCKLKLGDQKNKTSIRFKTLNPVQDETFQFKVQNDTEILEITIMDYDTIGDDEHLGELKILISDVLKEKRGKLSKESGEEVESGTGNLYLTLNYFPICV